MTDKQVEDLIFIYTPSVAARALQIAVLRMVEKRTTGETRNKFEYIIKVSDKLHRNYKNSRKDSLIAMEFVDFVRSDVIDNEDEGALAFLLWGTLPLESRYKEEETLDWCFEVVEEYFETKGWEIDEFYRLAFEIAEEIRKEAVSGQD